LFLLFQIFVAEMFELPLSNVFVLTVPTKHVKTTS